MSDHNIGIDYSRGQSNFDRDTGIHYGIISLHSLDADILNYFEPYYGEPTCPECGKTAQEYDNEKHLAWKSYRHDRCADYACEYCERVLSSDHVYGDDPVGHDFADDNYHLYLNCQNDVWVFKSPFFTYAQFCSPCAPGAGHLNNQRSADSGAPRTYCLDHSFFEGGIAPYDVYDVRTGELVPPPAEKVV